jgi:multidrug efflux system membrane fusion protein
MVHATDSTGLAVITQIETISVVFNLPEEGLQRILKAMKGHDSLDVQAFDRDMKTRIAVGKLAAVDNQIDPSTATAKFKANFDNEDAELFPNQFVNVRLLVETIKDAVIVPQAALQRSPNGIYVYVVKPDNTVENRTVTPGQSEGDDVQVASGLAEGETVVVDGVDKLRPGASVTPRSTNAGPTTGPSGQHGGGHRRQAQ